MKMNSFEFHVGVEIWDSATDQVSIYWKDLLEVMDKHAVWRTGVDTEAAKRVLAGQLNHVDHTAMNITLDHLDSVARDAARNGFGHFDLSCRVVDGEGRWDPSLMEVCDEFPFELIVRVEAKLVK